MSFAVLISGGRALLAAWFIVLAVAPGLSAARGAEPNGASKRDEVRFLRVWTGYREAESFTKFGEFRPRDAEPGDAIVLRSTPDDRNGYYFTVRLRARKGHVIPHGRVVLHVVPPDAMAPRTFEFPLTGDNTRGAQLLIGLTGPDWRWGGTMPLAWKIAVLDESGTEIGSEQSFLWSDS